ncbi:hypothetical protein [Amycolatopsis sp. NPDC059657]|uniref:hypothetical protein n=1 Tax=Amycolatopsis sp. NPDC059657 TaxID=3346899 RepID=UPI00366B1C8F
MTEKMMPAAAKGTVPKTPGGKNSKVSVTAAAASSPRMKPTPPKPFLGFGGAGVQCGELTVIGLPSEWSPGP